MHIKKNIDRLKKDIYISIEIKFIISLIVALMWMVISIILSIPWVKDLKEITNLFISLLIISGIAYIPGFMNALLVVSLLLDKQPKVKDDNPKNEITILVAAYNEEKQIYQALEYINKQDYAGKINTIVINNNSKDNTVGEVYRAKKQLGMNVKCIDEVKPGKFNALNKGLKETTTKYVLTLDADTLLHPQAVRRIVSRINSSPKEIAAVAGCVLVRNSRDNLLTKLQEWDYFLSISSIKRMQGLYQGTLVAQGAFSIYKTNIISNLGGWSDSIGEDIVLTWNMLSKNHKIYFEPLAVAFTDAPNKFIHFIRQRSRWARGMIEGLRAVKPWQQPNKYYKVLTGIDILLPYMDFAYTFFFIPGCILALFGHYYIVGPMILLVFPATLATFCILFSYQKRKVFNILNLKIRKYGITFVLFLLIYQCIMSPVSVYGYIQEIFNMKRVWK